MMTTLGAVRAGRAVFDWTPLLVSSRVRVWVMADALKVDGIRVNVSARVAQQIADSIGGTLTTPRIEDMIYSQADVRIEPFPGDVTKRTAGQHSADIDKALAGRTGLICTVGKAWVLSNRLSEQVAMNYGWHGQTARYAAATGNVGAKVWQQPGLKHNPDHVDYSQTCRLLRRRAELDGREIDVRDLLASPEFAPLLSIEGPLRVLRQPGVNEMADTEPGMPAITMSLGERCVEWSRAEMRRENPPSAARKAELLVRCMRSGKRIWTALTPAQAKPLNHCAAFASAAGFDCALAGETVPHDYRAGAKELMADAQGRGAWVAAARVREGWRPAVGDLAIYDRSQPGKPETAWWGHVDRVTEVGDDMYKNIGANEGAGGAWVEAWSSYDNHRLLGFVVYPRNSVASIQPPVSAGHPVSLPPWDSTDAPLEVDWDEYQANRRRDVRDSE